MPPSMQLSLSVTHLYPNHLNLYGDSGNLTVLQRRSKWLGIDCQIRQLDLHEKATVGQTDLYIMGGGQDRDQLTVVEDFHREKYVAIQEDTENGSVFLGVCGGYQLMGHTFLMGNGEEAEGLGLINVKTQAPTRNVKDRCTGNLIAELTPTIYQEIQAIYAESKEIPSTLVGFENHSGQTYLGDHVEPLANTLLGFGNNQEAVYEGARYKNVFGSYIHGPILPKNPHFADYLIWLALVHKYDDPTIKLRALPDQEELEAHNSLVHRYSSRSKARKHAV